MAGIPSNPADRKAIYDGMKEISNSMTRIEAERDLIKNAINDICEEQNLSKKTFRKMVKVYHKQNFQQEVQSNEEFEQMYETITQTTTMSKEYA
jgi:regulator of replication initiation timing